LVAAETAFGGDIPGSRAERCISLRAAPGSGILAAMNDEELGGGAPGGADDIAPGAGAPADADVSAPAEASVLGEARRLGRYVILELLGRGGMGEVYAAFDPELDRRIAIKLLRPGSRDPKAAQRRLAREARALARLSHPNVVHVYDVGVHGEAVFMAMELVPGQSLRAWCRQEPPPGWRPVLDAYLAAARGLAAAHAVGLVHRDFKPANVLRGHDGRVRVADFGVSAMYAMDEIDVAPTEPDTASAAGGAGVERAQNERLTSTGMLMGTPAYMAPEQFADPEVGPVADQYGFCVSLYEGLYGWLPFGLDPLLRAPEQTRRKLERPLERPPGTEVPEWVHRILARGLAPSPADRWPSMDALIAALEKDPAARRRALGRVLAVGALGAALAGLAFMVVAPRSQADPAAACAAGGQLAGVWDAAVKARMQQAFSDTGIGYASDTFDRVAAALDRHADQWTAMRTQVCEATYVQRTEPVDVMSLRVRCLEQQRSQMRALTELLARGPDPAVLPKAIPAARSLSPVEACSDVDALAQAMPLPADPELRAQVEALEARVDDLQAQIDAGKYAEGLERGAPLLADVAAVGYPPLQARALYVVATIRNEAADHAGAEALAREALEVAARARDDLLMARIWSLLVRVVGHKQARFDEALGMIPAAMVAAERAGDDHARADALVAGATVFLHLGRYEEATARNERAVALREKTLGTEHPGVAATLVNLANALTGMGRHEEARMQYDRALPILEHALGPRHPWVGSTLVNLGILLFHQGRYAEAQAMHARASGILEDALGPAHPHVAMARTSLGNALAHQGRYEDAQAQFERALPIMEQVLGAAHPDVIDLRTNLGDALAWQGRHEEARAVLARVAPLLEQAQGNARVRGALVSLGRTLIRVGDLDAAARHLDRADDIAGDPATPADASLAATLLGAGELALARNQPAQAVAPLERALALDGTLYRAEIELMLARALWASNGDRQRALDLARTAEAYYERLGNRARRDEVSRWLAAHAGAGATP
jgi:tetratricopeptide (TPR) repeat protein